jgi:hypothetical protein
MVEGCMYSETFALNYNFILDPRTKNCTSVVYVRFSVDLHCYRYKPDTTGCGIVRIVIARFIRNRSPATRLCLQYLVRYRSYCTGLKRHLKGCTVLIHCIIKSISNHEFQSNQIIYYHCQFFSGHIQLCKK